MLGGNIPKVRLGIIAVSRDCFPIELSVQRRENIVKAYKDEIYNCSVIVENEKDMLKAVEEVKAAACNAIVVFLGNFGPETPETLIAERFDGPVMYVAAAEGDGDMINGRGDAFCGMLNCSYNLGMRHLKSYIPEYPVGTAEEIAQMISDFVPVARAVIGLQNLKIISFGPRPQDFFACNAPIRGLYEIGVEIEENSELDLLVAFKAHENDPRIDEVCEDMAKEMGEGSYYPDLYIRSFLGVPIPMAICRGLYFILISLWLGNGIALILSIIFAVTHAANFLAAKRDLENRALMAGLTEE